MNPIYQTQYDLIVIGGGPAGSAAAFTAASQGIRACLIDKCAFPRDKLCGGLVTGRSKGLFESVFRRSWDERLFVSTDRIRLCSDNKFLADNNGYSTLYFTMRKDFDNYLLGLAAEAPVDLKLDAEVADLDLENRRLQLRTGEVLAFRFLIGADGVNSEVARKLFGVSFDSQTIGFGLEVEVPRTELADSADRVEIDFGAARWGYGWIFPKRETFTIGVGGIHRLNPQLRSSLERYLSHKQLAIADYKVKGQYIPFGDFRKIPGRDNVLLCGDAAGVVDPITGEGIAYAMETGSAAARAVVACVRSNSGTSALTIYSREYSAISASIRQANIWRWLIFPKPMHKPFTWAVVDANMLQNGYLDIIAGKQRYDALYGLFLRQVGKAVRKGLLSILRKFRGVSADSKVSN